MHVFIVYTDESRFTLFRPDGQRRGERFADACVLERDRFGGGSVMVWGGISHGLKSPLIPSPLPHWKLSGTMCHQPSDMTCVTCTSEHTCDRVAIL
jgi:hypothetical protein